VDSPYFKHSIHTWTCQAPTFTIPHPLSQSFEYCNTRWIVWQRELWGMAERWFFAPTQKTLIISNCVSCILPLVPLLKNDGRYGNSAGNFWLHKIW